MGDSTWHTHTHTHTHAHTHTQYDNAARYLHELQGAAQWNTTTKTIMARKLPCPGTYESVATGRGHREHLPTMHAHNALTSSVCHGMACPENKPPAKVKLTKNSVSEQGKWALCGGLCFKACAGNLLGGSGSAIYLSLYSSSLECGEQQTPPGIGERSQLPSVHRLFSPTEAELPGDPGSQTMNAVGDQPGTATACVWGSGRRAEQSSTCKLGYGVGLTRTSKRGRMVSQSRTTANLTGEAGDRPLQLQLPLLGTTPGLATG